MSFRGEVGLAPKEATARANVLHQSLGALVPFPIVLAIIAKEAGADLAGLQGRLWALVEA